MSSPPEQPRLYAERHAEPPSVLRSNRPPPAVIPCGFILFAFLALLTVGVAYWLLRQPSTAPLSPIDASATAEAHTFATAQANRQATREAANAATTAYAQAGVTARAQAQSTSLAYANITATARAKATAEAPPTLTAQAKEFLEAEANAQATVQSLEPSAVKVYGPSSGTLAHSANNTAVCDDTGVQLGNFAAEARFYNPYPIDHDWDYGLVFTNPHDGSQYNVVLDGDQNRSFRLQSPGYYVQLLDTTHLIDNSDTGSNLLKLYVVDEVAHLYINNRFEATVDLTGLDFGNVPAEPHGLLICTGLIDGDMQPGKSTRYADFTVWKLP